MSRPDTPPRAYVRLGKRRIPIPRHKATRVAAGSLFTFVGIFPPAPLHLLFPVGIVMLSVDFPRLRRLRRRLTVRIGRRRTRSEPAGMGAAA